MKTYVETLAHNQYAIFTPSGSVYFQSYETMVARVDGIGSAGDVFLIRNACNLSKTTSKYLYKFLLTYSMIEPSFANKKGILSLIKDGSIVEVDDIK